MSDRTTTLRRTALTLAGLMWIGILVTSVVIRDTRPPEVPPVVYSSNKSAAKLGTYADFDGHFYIKGDSLCSPGLYCWTHDIDNCSKCVGN